MFRKHRAKPELRPVHERPCMVLVPQRCTRSAVASTHGWDECAVHQLERITR